MDPKSHTIRLIVGDWYGNGHDKTEDVIVKTNLDKNALLAAFKEGSEELGFNFQEKVCADYEDNTIADKYSWILQGHGIEVFSDEEFEEANALDTISYVKIWLEIAKLGNEDLEYEIVNTPSIPIGGYGLFW